MPARDFELDRLRSEMDAAQREIDNAKSRLDLISSRRDTVRVVRKVPGRNQVEKV